MLHKAYLQMPSLLRAFRKLSVLELRVHLVVQPATSSAQNGAKPAVSSKIKLKIKTSVQKQDTHSWSLVAFKIRILRWHSNFVTHFCLFHRRLLAHSPCSWESVGAVGGRGMLALGTSPSHPQHALPWSVAISPEPSKHAGRAFNQRHQLRA